MGASTEAENEGGEKPGDLIDPECKDLAKLFETGLCAWAQTCESSVGKNAQGELNCHLGLENIQYGVHHVNAVHSKILSVHSSV